MSLDPISRVSAPVQLKFCTEDLRVMPMISFQFVRIGALKAMPYFRAYTKFFR
jgi:hypothetical protein